MNSLRPKIETDKESASRVRNSSPLKSKSPAAQPGWQKLGRLIGNRALGRVIQAKLRMESSISPGRETELNPIEHGLRSSESESPVMSHRLRLDGPENRGAPEVRNAPISDPIGADSRLRITPAPLAIARVPEEGVPDAGVPDAGTPGPEEDQLACVNRLGGSPRMRPGGLPTCREIRDYNERCREETRYTGPDIDPVGVCEQERQEARLRDDSGNTDPLDMSNRPLDQGDRDAIEGAIGESGGGGPIMPRGVRFTLHDTAANVSGARIREIAARESRGALGGGVTAFVPATGAATMTRPQFYEARRPTTSEWEKVMDVIDQPTREAALRQVWGATRNNERDAALIGATRGLGLTAQQATSERQRARTQLSAPAGMIFTTAHWTVQEICDRYASLGTAVARTPAVEADLRTGCAALARYFTERTSRLSTSTNVELVQQPGSHCRASGRGLVPLPPYTATQYQQIVRLYLRAALEAGRFPEVTTHFWIDRSFRGHCDPRCFNLGLYYGQIASIMRHPTGARYGAPPNYGVRWGTHNVWWQNTVCGGAPP